MLTTSPGLAPGHEAAPIVGVGKSACVQVMNSFFHPGGAANQQDPHLLLAGCQRVEVERQNERRGANFILTLMLAIGRKTAGNGCVKYLNHRGSPAWGKSKPQKSSHPVSIGK